MSITRSIFFVMALAIALPNIGCASFQTGKLDRDVVLPPAAEPKPSIAVVVSGRARMGSGADQDVPPRMLESWKNETVEAYRDSGLFSRVESGFSDADLRAEVDVYNTGDPNMGLAFLSGLTLTLIPAKASDVLTMTTVFRNADGEELATIQREEVVDTWIQLFLFPVMPFKWPGSVIGDAFEDLVTSTLAGAGEALSGTAGGP